LKKHPETDESILAEISSKKMPLSTYPMGAAFFILFSIQTCIFQPGLPEMQGA